MEQKIKQDSCIGANIRRLREARGIRDALETTCDELLAER